MVTRFFPIKYQHIGRLSSTSVRTQDLLAMSFRKRNVAVATSNSHSQGVQPPLKNASISSRPPGTRPSPVDGRLTTSTGTQSLDNLLAGHAGLALGNSLLVEESGTTDFAGVLLRYFAAEGVVQDHRVHVVGMGEGWSRELPGLVGAIEESTDSREKERMKIAWRYERLGEHGSGSRGEQSHLESLYILNVKTCL
jgi:elongator complex protein 4